MRLSILICSLDSRLALLQRLLDRLRPQGIDGVLVQMIINSDGGQMSIGDKRNQLVNAARGDYVAFVDDDDLVSADYVAKILSAVESNPDCCGIEGVITTGGKDPRRFVHTLACAEWHERDGVYYRSPNHLNPIRREIAARVPFPSSNYGEDHDFSKRVKPLLKTESYIEGTIYHYLYEPDKPK